MPLNGPFQPDGQELKAAHTQKPLGSREGSSPRVCPREGRHPSTKSTVKTSPLFNGILGRQLYSTPTPTPTLDGELQQRMALHGEALRGLEAEIKIQQINNRMPFSLRAGWGSEPKVLKGASVCPSCTSTC